MHGQTVLFVPDTAQLEAVPLACCPWPQPLTRPRHTKELGAPSVTAAAGG